MLRLSSAQKRALLKLGITEVRDLLYHFPARYESAAEVTDIAHVQGGTTATIYGVFSELAMKKSWKTRTPMAEGKLTDGTGSLRVVWFHQPYLAKMVPSDTPVRVRGKVTVSKGKKYIANPVVEKAAGLPDLGASFLDQNKRGLFPVYPESSGVTSLWFYHAVKKALASGVLKTMEDPISSSIRETYHLPPLAASLIWIHEPKREKDAEAARKRFAFEEVFLIQVARAVEREAMAREKSFEVDAKKSAVDDFIQSFPFKPTEGQKHAIDDILEDFSHTHPMNRLLEGDVGSGKTAVAAATAYAVVTSRPRGQSFGNLQTAYMVPTEILAKQHFKTFTSFFKDHPIQIGLITSSQCYKFPSKVNKNDATKISRTLLLKWIQNGEIPIVIGTHALIQKSCSFKHLAYVIIDEQHRFGTAQRYALARGKTQTERGTNAEKVDLLLYKDLTYVIRNVLFEIKKTLGLGHKELIYQNAFEEELKRRKISYSKERQIPILYRGKKVGVYQPDFVIDEKIIVEFKSIPFLGQKEKKQLWTYLKGSEYHLGLLINFGGADLEIQRVIYDTARRKNSASSLRESASSPHLLSMTATPIPRTLALTLYGDLDLTILDELPAGRKPIKTEVVATAGRDTAYEKIRALITEGRQAYVICPRIDEPDPQKALALQARSVASEYKLLKEKVFPELAIGKLHSKMTPKEKEDAMNDFANGKTNILVATSVVEVGVNVPNATVIMIEGAERFGLAQLHQLRGRVMRSAHQPYCFLMVERNTDNARLKAIQSAKNGFELAEKDLSIRGAGELYGRHQWGLSDIGMDALKNIKLVEAAREEAFKLVQGDPELTRAPLLRALSEKKINDLHFE